MPRSAEQLSADVHTLQKSVQTLSDDKLDRGDIRAVAMILFVLASFAMSAYSFASIPSESAEATAAASDTDTDTE